MCDNPFDQYYTAHGGRNPRVDMVHGRVGSVFSDASQAPVGDVLLSAPDGELVEPFRELIEPYHESVEPAIEEPFGNFTEPGTEFPADYPPSDGDVYAEDPDGVEQLPYTLDDGMSNLPGDNYLEDGEPTPLEN